MEINVQASAFSTMVLTGMLLGLLFDFYRVLHSCFKPRWFITAIGDLAYWLVAAAVTFVALLGANGGELRLYVFLALVTGAAGYYRLLSRPVRYLLMRLVRTVAAVMRWMRLILLWLLVKPVVLVVRVMWLPFGYVVRLAGSLRRPPGPPPEENVPPPG
ncbi:spore cortex biosynthesis protein YabQ [Sporolituus thermophilus]|uniref:Spore cortex biosynthesis protein YabQ n=1 Tax=Sporolituus thermophilus DSM 23256 TaxID=1123285 RepID=A0A1G7IWF6_9FIRM|nr:spore cortex biosynthesis protein YabQ [Sporolituus thermophilus]SDF16983.1 spore cortex biosynthesis protein YabQ [Sporolituus thermophilus DSM 23256]